MNTGEPRYIVVRRRGTEVQYQSPKYAWIKRRYMAKLCTKADATDECARLKRGRRVGVRSAGWTYSVEAAR